MIKNNKSDLLTTAKSPVPTEVKQLHFISLPQIDLDKTYNFNIYKYESCHFFMYCIFCTFMQLILFIDFRLCVLVAFL